MRQPKDRPGDEPDLREREERRRKSVRLTLLCAFGLLLAGGIAGAYFTRNAAFVPAWAQAAPSPSPAPSIKPFPSPSAAQAIQPSPSPDATEAFCATSIYVDGALAGVVASREAAEALLADATSYFELRAEGIGLPVTSIENEVELREATQEEIAALSTYEALYALLTGEDTPLQVKTTLTSSVMTNVPCETSTQESEYLLKGMRLIVSMGRDGSAHEVTVTSFVNGEKKGEPVTTVAAAVAPVDGSILIGTKRIDKSADPGKREGQKGPGADDLTFIRPVKGADITLNYGQYRGALHLGLDFDVKEGGEVLASCAGTIVCVMERGGYGLMVEIDHGNGFVTRYAHLSRADVTLGQSVAQGDAIGLAGKTGNAKAPVLHFELRIDGIAYNPRFYLA